MLFTDKQISERKYNYLVSKNEIENSATASTEYNGVCSVRHERV